MYKSIKKPFLFFTLPSIPLFALPRQPYSQKPQSVIPDAKSLSAAFSLPDDIGAKLFGMAAEEDSEERGGSGGADGITLAQVVVLQVRRRGGCPRAHRPLSPTFYFSSPVQTNHRVPPVFPRRISYIRRSI